MSRYIETIRIEDGTARNLEFHQARFERTRSDCLGVHAHPLLGDVIRIPAGMMQGLVKCRILYGIRIGEITFEPYVRRPAATLKVIRADQVDYPYKSADRSGLERLFALRGKCDDILIIRKGMVTDSFAANVALWDGHRWHTPGHPLLPGTMRASLLARGIVSQAHIGLGQLERYREIRLINAFFDLEEAPGIGVPDLEY